jgi:hypothetical protein
VTGVAPRLGLLARTCVLGLSATACKPITTDLLVDVILPENATDLEATNNVSIVLDPGETSQFETDGLDFSIELELDPSSTLRTLALYLAQNEELLAWGRTAEFTLERRDPVGIFVGRPGQLSTYPLALDVDDDGLMGASVFGRGIVLLASSGAVTFIDEISAEVASGATLANPPLATDGALVGDALGGAARVRWADGIGMDRFDVGEDEWIDVDLAGASAIEPRPGAAWWADADGTVLFVFGGGEATDIVAIDLVATEDAPPSARILPEIELDAPRKGASAGFVVRDDGDDGELTYVCGGEDDVELLRFVERGTSVGPVGAWTGARCVQLDRGGAEVTLRLLCGGGIRADMPTADAVEFVLGPAGTDLPALVVDHPGLLGRAMPDIRWFVDDVAVYAQGEAALQPFAIASLEPALVLPALRAAGGFALALPTGATLLAGGTDETGIPSTRMQMFVPALPPS